MITAGEVLKKKRESLGKNLETVSLDTKIQKRFLEYIEKNEFDRFESDVFLTGFLKIYSQYLNLDVEKVLALYRRSKPQVPMKKEKKKTSKKEASTKKFILKDKLTPKTIITALIGLFLASIITYIGLQIYKFQSPPALTVSEPTDEMTTENEKIWVRGTTLPEAQVEINEHLITVSEDGDFEYEITLNEGINTITIKALKNSNNVLETIETRKVIYNKSKEEIKVEDKPEQKNTVTLEVSGVASWVRLDVDQINKVSQVLQPSRQEFEVKNSFYVITGRASNTFLYFNNEPVDWNNRNTTGVAEITCTVKNNNITCQ